jgi:ubiquinol-cytochrome c reductase iron-sulfur subunit
LSEHHDMQPTRRDFIHIATGTVAALGGVMLAWPFIDQMNPAADTLAMASTEVDLSTLAEGAEVRIKWRGKPVFVRHRSQAEIDEARAVDLSKLKDPQSDDERLALADGTVGNPKYLVMIANCTHLGCVPLGDGAGDYKGWFCPCHGSHYDGAGRIRKGPAPLNLVIPPYTYLSDTTIKIG